MHLHEIFLQNLKLSGNYIAEIVLRMNAAKYFFEGEDAWLSRRLLEGAVDLAETLDEGINNNMVIKADVFLMLAFVMIHHNEGKAYN
jgi:hypothetical protein